MHPGLPTNTVDIISVFDNDDKNDDKNDENILNYRQRD